MFLFSRIPRIFGDSLVAFVLSLGIYGSVLAAEGGEIRTVTTEYLQELLNSNSPVALVDARTAEEFQDAHIGSAINIQEKEFNDKVGLLPADKNSLIILYCNGVKCGKSKKVAAKAQVAGHTNVAIYSDGFPVWEEKGLPIVAGPEYEKKVETNKLPPHEIQKIISRQQQEYIIVDVRDASEFAQAHIPTAINIPVEVFASRSDVLPKDKKIIVYCNNGGRSYMAYRKLIKLAYSNIHQAVFAEWQDAGLPVENGR